MASSTSATACMITRDCISLLERRGSPPRSIVATPKPSTVSTPSIARTSRSVMKVVILELWTLGRAAARAHPHRDDRSASKEPAPSLLGQLIMTRKYGAGHRIGGVHHVRLGHREGRDVVGDRVEVLGIAGALRCADTRTTEGSDKSQRGDEDEAGTVHQLFRSRKGFGSYRR